MSRHAVLNNQDHKNLRVITQSGAEYGDQVMSVPVYPIEIRNVQSEYPIVFAHDPNSETFKMVALFGFEHNENLYLQDGKWRASYKPLIIEKGPFLIGRNDQQPDTLSIHIDLEHPRLNEVQGQPIFSSLGGNTEYIDNIANILSTIHEGEKQAQAFIDRLNEFELIESFALDIQLNNGDNHRLSGMFAINEDKLAALSDDQLLTLHKDSYLQHLYMIVGSMSQFRRLIDFKNAQLVD